MVPKFIKPFLWSFDLDKLDLKKHKRQIIINVLNLGTKKATDWLFKAYPKKDIAMIIGQSQASEWHPKSLNYWSIVLGKKPKNNSRLLH